MKFLLQNKYIYGVMEYSFFDSYWAFIHFLSGMIVGLIILEKVKYSKINYFLFGLTLLFIFEVFEEVILRNLKKLPPFQFMLDLLNIGFLFGKESAINISSDLILGSLGLFLILLYFNSSLRK